jgi:IclR helix-turn-helix domain
MNPAGQTRDRLVKSIVHSSQSLRAFCAPGEGLPLKEISARCGLPKTMVFRLLAGIPMIAIDIPHPGATYYGAHNYEAGLIG